MTDLVTSATIKPTLDDSAFNASGARIVDTANKISTATDGATESITRVGKSATTSANGFDKLQAQNDKLYGASQRYAQQLSDLERYHEAGIATGSRYADTLAGIEQKYAAATAANDNHVSGLGRLGSALGSVNAFLGAFGLALGVEKIVEWGKGLLESTAHLEQQAKVLGISTDALQAFRAAAVLSGVGATVGDAAIQRFTRSIGDATEVMGPARKAFIDLHLAAADLAGGAENALPKVAEALLQVKDASARAREEVALFGKSGQETEQLLEKWADPNLIHHMDDLGLVVKKQLIDQLDEAAKGWDIFWLKFDIAALNAANVLSKLSIPGTVAGNINGDPRHRGVTEVPAQYHFTAVPGSSDAGGTIPDWKGANKDLDDYLGKLKLAAELQGDTVEQRKIDNSWIEAANAKLKDQGQADTVHITSALQAYKILGDTVAAQVTLNVLTADANAQRTAENLTVANALAATGGVVLWNEKLLSNLEDQSKVHDDILKKQIKELSQVTFQSDASKAAATDAISKLQDQVYLAGLSREQREAESLVLKDINGKNLVLTDEQQAQVVALGQTLEATKQWRLVVDDVSHGFENMFSNFLETGKLKISSLWDSIRDGFAKLLAQMATQALAEPVIIPLVASIGGALGLSSGALGSTGSGANAIGAAAASAPGGGVLGAFGNVLGLNGLLGGGAAAEAFPASIGVTASPITGAFSDGSWFGSAVGGPGLLGTSVGGLGTIGGLLGGAGVGLGVGSLAGSLLGGNSTGSAIGGTLGGLAGTLLTPILGPLGPILGSALGGALGGLVGGKPSNYTAYANFGSDYSLTGGAAGDKPNQTTTGLASQAGSAISSAAKALEAAGITLQGGVSRLEIGQRDQSRLYLSNGTRVNVGAAGDEQAAVSGTLDYLLKTASSADDVTQKILDAYKQEGKLSSQYADQIISDVTSVKNILNISADAPQLTQAEQTLKNINDQFGAAIDKLNSLGIDSSDLVSREQKAISDLVNGYNQQTADNISKLSNPILEGWTSLLSAQDTRMKEALALGADVAQVQKENFLEQEGYLLQLDDAQRSALSAQIDLANNLALAVANAQSAASQAVSNQITLAQQFSSQMRQAATDYENAADSIAKAQKAFLVGDLSPLNPIDQYNVTKQQFEQTAASAQTGDLTSLNGLSSAAQAFLTQSLSVNAATQAYGKDFQEVQDLLNKSQAAADASGKASSNLADLADQQLTVLNDISTVLKSPGPDVGYLQKQIDLLNSISQKGQDTITAIQTGSVQTVGALFQTALSASTLQGTGVQSALNGFIDALHQETVALQNIVAQATGTPAPPATEAPVAPAAPPGLAIDQTYAAGLNSAISEAINLILQTTSKQPGRDALNATLASTTGAISQVSSDGVVTPTEVQNLSDAIAQLAKIVDTSNGSTASSILELKSVIAALQRFLTATS